MWVLCSLIKITLISLIVLVTQGKSEWYLSESSSFRLSYSIANKDYFLLIFTALSGIFFVYATNALSPLTW